MFHIRPPRTEESRDEDPQVDAAHAREADAGLSLKLKFLCRVNGRVADESIVFDLCETAAGGDGEPWNTVSFADVANFVREQVV